MDMLIPHIVLSLRLIGQVYIAVAWQVFRATQSRDLPHDIRDGLIALLTRVDHA